MGFDELDRLLDGEIDGKVGTNAPSSKPDIVVVDDDSKVREVLVRFLADTYNVIPCASGDEGIASVNKDVYAVLLDIKMRDKDGFETFEEIKENWPEIPIIFHSAYQNIKDPCEIMNRYRPFGYIMKGGNNAELLDTLASATEYYRQKLFNEKLIENLQKANNSLEAQAEELRLANIHLEKEIKEHVQAKRELAANREQLEELIAKLTKISNAILSSSSGSLSP